MNAEPESTTPTQPEAPTEFAAPKSSIVSIPFILIVIVLLAGGYPAGKWAMEKFIFMEENAKGTGAPIAPPEDLERTGIGAMDQQNRDMGGGRPGAGGGGGRDPGEIFSRLDADENGKLEGDEISERMQGRMEDLDTDSDGVISKEEFLKAMENRRGRQEAGEDGKTPPENDKSDEGNE